jgi:phosphate:Na+ symporter
MTWHHFTLVFGGLGLFLLGMTFLTDGLKAMAGASLRSLLARFTRGKISALFTGLVFTAGVQSSSATTIATIGFVNAGLLTFPQALGVLYGANLGTTVTAWMVTLLGIKINAASFALPLIGLGAILKMFGRNTLAPLGLAMAGFGVLFLGIDMMQEGMTAAGEWTFLANFSAASISGRLILVGIGAIMTIVMQSSSAALAVTLTAAATGAIELPDAAALAIGQNIGTTFKAVLASLGGTPDARRAAAGHVLFNVVTAAVAITILDPLLTLAEFVVLPGVGVADAAMVLAAFHTGFNLLGILLLTPFIDVKTRYLKKMFRRDDDLVGQPRYLDKNVLTVPGTALEAVEREFEHLASLVAQTIALGTRHSEERSLEQADLKQAEHFHDAVLALSSTIGDYLERIERLPETTTRIFAFVRVLEHLRGATQKTYTAALQRGLLGTAATRGRLAEAEDIVSKSLQSMREAGLNRAERTAQLSGYREAAQEMREGLRGAIFHDVAEGRISAALALDLADYVTLLERSVYHLARAYHYWHVQDQSLVEKAPETLPPVEPVGV